LTRAAGDARLHACAIDAHAFLEAPLRTAIPDVVVLTAFRAV
jgi:hypothetical protein